MAHGPVTQFFLQITVILIVCRAVGQLIARAGQPRVVGEMIAGVLLGPSLLGLIAPSMHDALFPQSSLAAISVVSQVGLVLYMFCVGTHLQRDFITAAFRGAMLISLAGVVAPFVLGDRARIVSSMPMAGSSRRTCRPGRA